MLKNRPGAHYNAARRNHVRRATVCFQRMEDGLSDFLARTHHVVSCQQHKKSKLRGPERMTSTKAMADEAAAGADTRHRDMSRMSWSKREDKQYFFFSVVTCVLDFRLFS